jgi:hypothetical protein
MPRQAVERKRAVSREKRTMGVAGRRAIIAGRAQKLRLRRPDVLQEDRTD